LPGNLPVYIPGGRVELLGRDRGVYGMGLVEGEGRGVRFEMDGVVVRGFEMDGKGEV
jgi:hypothetical protein